MILRFVQLVESSPFYNVFQRGRAPIVECLLPQRVVLEGSEETEVFFLDLVQCSEAQLFEIAGILSRQSGISESQIRREFMRTGLPIRLSQISGVSRGGSLFL